MDITEFSAAVNQICSERGIDPDEVYEAIESAVLAAYHKDYGGGESLKAEIDRNSGAVHIIADKKVVKKVTEEDTQISLKDASKIEPNLKIDDHVEIEIPVDGFGRIAAQTAKQVILQKFRESERDAIISEFKGKINTVVTGLIQRMIGSTAVVEIGKATAYMPPEEQIPNEFYKIGERYKFYVKEIKDNQDLIVSRAVPEFLIELFKIEVPEIESNTVEIKAVAREAGSRSKLAVISNQEGVDPIGSCVGQKGVRIANIMSELGEEKIDIIEWDPEKNVFVANALGPAQVNNVEIKDEDIAKVLVDDDQLSLAIGKDGQNVRLAAKLTDMKIDITSPGLRDAQESKKDDESEDKGSTNETEEIKSKGKAASKKKSVKKSKTKSVKSKTKKSKDAAKSKNKDAALSSRILGVLKKAEVSVDSLKKMKEADIKNIKGIGAKAFEEIIKFVKNGK
ncbi:transcription termination/antitermination protein NusA [Candidatus Dojkabacteria bacterium]|nr:transcription termination/antitermination protein NusA [Candidatus Dojkabacteria bacterium]